MKVRFKEKYCADINNRIAYELQLDETGFNNAMTPCYNTKLLGLIPIRQMEITTDENDIEAIDVWVKLSLLQ
jgi:hypothetical protein